MTITFALAMLAIASVSHGAQTTATTPAATGGRCPQGRTAAVIAGKRVCLRRGQPCAKRLDRQYHRYRFHCHSGRLTSAVKPLPPAGKVVATVPASSWGDIEVGAGSVWVASHAQHIVTRIDPTSNAIVATIPVGSETVDPLHGVTEMGFGLGTLWVLDGTADCSCVHRIDPSTNRVVATIPLGIPASQGRVAPLGIAVQPDAVWVALRRGNDEAPDGAVVRVDPITNQVVAVIGAGSSPEFGGPTGITAAADAVWAGVPSTKSVVRIDPATDSVVATIPGLACGEGDLAADESGGVWIADCTAVRRIDPVTNAFSLVVPIPGDPLSAGARGIAVGLGSLWVQSDLLFRVDPITGVIRGTLPIDPTLGWEASVATGFGSVWVRQIDRVVRIDP